MGSSPEKLLPAYAELHCLSNFSFLRGASQPEELVARAAALGYAALAITDECSLAGIVRAHVAAKEHRLKLIVGSELRLQDGLKLVLLAPDRAAYGALCALITAGRRRAKKGSYALSRKDVESYLQEGLLALWVPEEKPSLENALWIRERFPGRSWLAAELHHGANDFQKLKRLQDIADRAGLPLAAAGDVHMHLRSRRRLQDALTAIRVGRPVHECGCALHPNGERHLRLRARLAQIYSLSLLKETLKIADRCHFSLDELRYEYPEEIVPADETPTSYLRRLALEGMGRRYPEGAPESVRALIEKELALIAEVRYEAFFLTVYDIVRFAREEKILCQGRGSAANSAVCYCLGITEVDPQNGHALFERFISKERGEPPDIDVDFEHERREEVIQYIYRRYGRDRAGIAATVIHYRQRSAIREVGKALGLTEDVTARLSGTIWGNWGGEELPEGRLAEAGFDPANPELARLRDMVGQLLDYPRHLSQHVGGFVLSESRLDELVPIHNGAMPERTFIEWDKDDLETLGLMKVDVLALGMLTAIRKCFDLLRLHGLGDFELATVPREDPATYAMLQTGDSIGTFQVESRAQIAMLPRMKPKCLYDLVIQVAIVRPGPIQGGMVHPYLRRRAGEEAVEYPGPPGEIRSVLEKTLGVPLFQEQAMKLAIVAAQFTPAQADGLRRAMATFRHNGTMHHYEARLVEGMVGRGYPRDFAERCFEQIKGFGEYGFPESHAQAFGWLAYVSSWLKCHYPAAFTAALLNSQPMGFYAPAQLVRDAQEHAVEVRPIDVGASGWDSTLESERMLRLGLRQIGGFREAWAEALVAARGQAPIAGMEDLARRARLPARALRLLADADALGALGQNRRAAGWEARRVPPAQLPLFAALEAPELGQEADPELPAMSAAEEVVVDYQTYRLSLKGHPMQFLRGHFAAQGALTCAAVNAARDGAKVRTAGVVLIRQRPGKGNAVFITIEDETAVVNALLWARDMEDQRRAVMASRVMLLDGTVQRSKENVVHLMVERVTDASAALGLLSHLAPAPADHVGSVRDPGGGPEVRRHPRDVRIIPRSRDFH